MAHRKMIATKPMRYGTRMLRAGDSLTLSGPNARLHEALGRAETALAPSKVKTAATDDVAALREEYQAKFDRRPFYGWDAATLREKIAAA